MHVFINELSFISQTKSETEADLFMSKLLKVILSLKSIRGSDPLCTSGKLWEKELYKGYNVHRWLQTIDNQDKKRLFMSVVRKGPYIEELLDQKHKGFYECRLKDSKEDVSFSSLAGAVLFDGILTSLCNAGRYSAEEIFIKYRIDGKNFLEKDIDNFTICEKANEYVYNKEIESLKTWNDLLSKKAALFPELAFCDSVDKSVNSLDFMQVKQIVLNHLKQMNIYCQKLNNNRELIPQYDKMGIDASIESESTINRFGDQREFMCPDGNRRIFRWHSKQHGYNIRIHFYPPDRDNKNFIIGYIGQHLDTTRDHS